MTLEQEPTASCTAVAAELGDKQKKRETLLYQMGAKKRPVLDLPRQHLDLKGECRNGSGCSDEIFHADLTAHGVSFSLFPTKLTIRILMSINQCNPSAYQQNKRKGGKVQVTANAPEAQNFLVHHRRRPVPRAKGASDGCASGQKNWQSSLTAINLYLPWLCLLSTVSKSCLAAKRQRHRRVFLTRLDSGTLSSLSQLSLYACS